MIKYTNFRQYHEYKVENSHCDMINCCVCLTSIIFGDSYVWRCKCKGIVCEVCYETKDYAHCLICIPLGL